MSKTHLTQAEIKMAELYGAAHVARIVGTNSTQITRIMERYGKKPADKATAAENITKLIMEHMGGYTQK